MMQLACRDRNRLALEADLMGASMHGVTNIARPTTSGARRVFDIDGPQLITLARSLESCATLGRSFSPSPHFFIGAVENPGTPLFEYRVRRAAMKATACGAFSSFRFSDCPELLDVHAGRPGLSERLALIPSMSAPWAGCGSWPPSTGGDRLHGRPGGAGGRPRARVLRDRL